MDTGQTFIFILRFAWPTSARPGIEFQPVRARSTAICFRLTGLSPSEIGFLPFSCPGGPKKEQNQWCAAACLGVARGTMPKRQPSVFRRRVLHSDDPPNVGHQRWVIVAPLGFAATVVLARVRSMMARRALIASVDGRRAPAPRVVAPVGRAARCSRFLPG